MRHRYEYDKMIAKEAQIINNNCEIIRIDKAIEKVSDWLETLNTDILVDILNDSSTKAYYLAKLKNKMEGN